MPGSPQLSIVIPVYDNWWLTARCLRELDRLKAQTGVSFETIVVDNASTDETPQRISDFPSVRYRRHETNQNFAGACNAGVRMAEAPIVLLLNNDAYPLGNALTPLVRALDRPEVVIAGGALFFEDGVTQAAGLVMLQNAHWHYFCRNLPADLNEVNSSRDAIGVSGAAMAVRTQWFLENGGFDESFINGFEDVDLCLRAREAGCTIAYVAEARFAHYEGASAGRFDRERENERRFFDRWSPRLGSIPRIARGSVGAITVRSGVNEDALLRAAREDLEEALRSFGHPVLHEGIPMWRRFDRRFREAAALEWFDGEGKTPAVAVRRRGGSAVIQTHGALDVEVPWLPCASADRVATISVRPSSDPLCRSIGVAGSDADVQRCGLDGDAFARITPEMLLGTAPPVELACVAHVSLTDDAAFGNVLLAQRGIPAVVCARPELEAIFAHDVAVITAASEIRDAVMQMAGDAGARDRYGALAAADARRRFSPRRSAVRVVDLLCAARFGMERPGLAVSNTPL